MENGILDLNAIATIDDVEHCLDRLLREEDRIDVQLESLVDPKNQPDLSFLERFHSSLRIEDQLSQLTDKIGPVAETARGLRERVQKLDLEQSRIKECLKYVEDVQVLKVDSLFNKLNGRVVYWEYMMLWTSRIGMKQLPLFIKRPYWTSR